MSILHVCNNHNIHHKPIDTDSISISERVLQYIATVVIAIFLSVFDKQQT